MPYRTTITINFPIHSTKEEPKYFSARLTVFTFGRYTQIQRIADLLREFLEGQIGYGEGDWWDFEYNLENNTPVDFGETDIGYYRAYLAYEDEDGETTDSEIRWIQEKRFGELTG